MESCIGPEVHTHRKDLAVRDKRSIADQALFQAFVDQNADASGHCDTRDVHECGRSMKDIKNERWQDPEPAVTHTTDEGKESTNTGLATQAIDPQADVNLQRIKIVNDCRHFRVSRWSTAKFSCFSATMR